MMLSSMVMFIDLPISHVREILLCPHVSQCLMAFILSLIASSQNEQSMVFSCVSLIGDMEPAFIIPVGHLFVFLFFFRLEYHNVD